MKLYQISNEYQQAFDNLSEMDLSHEVIADSLASIKGEFEDKAKAIVAIILNLEAENLGINAALAKMTERRMKNLRKIGNLREYLLKNMEVCNIKNIKTDEFAVSIRKNPPRLVVDENALPGEYIEVEVIEERNILKDKLKELLKEGIVIPGAKLEQSTRLHIE